MRLRKKKQKKETQIKPCGLTKEKALKQKNYATKIVERMHTRQDYNPLKNKNAYIKISSQR